MALLNIQPATRIKITPTGKMRVVTGGGGGGGGAVSTFWSNWIIDPTTSPFYEVTGTANITVNGNNLEIDNRAGLTSLNASYSYGEGSVDASNCSNLTSLNVGFNGIHSLNVSGCTSLTTLNCWYNFNLTSLDISSCTSLNFLYCGGNGLTTLDVSNNTALTNLSCNSNSLTEVAVNNILTTIDGFGTSNGYLYLNGGTNAAPTGAGLTAKSSLESRGWNVYTN